MSHRNTAKVLAAAAAAAGLAGFGASKADASLIIDVRATAVNGSSAGVVNGKTVNVLQNGDIVTMGVFAQISGTNGVNDETLTNTQGSWTSTGGLLGNLSNQATATFAQSGYTNGNQTDFDSDGDLDVGSTGTTASNKFAGRAAPAASGTTIIDTNTSEIQVSTLTFTVTGGSGSAVVQFIPRQGGNTSLWNEDGVATSKQPSSGTFAASPTGVTIGAVPEPASIGLLGLASVGLLARRRDKKA